MPYTPSGKNAMLDHLGTLVTHVSLHSAFPGDTGTNEISGGSPAYARKAITWNAAASGNLDSSNQPAFDVPASTTVAWLGFWSASTAGTIHGYVPLQGGTQFTPRAFFIDETADTVICHGHGLANATKVVFYGDTAPGGLTEGTQYFVVGSATDTFQVSATEGGAAIDLTSEGGANCRFSKIVPETFGAQGTMTITDADLAIGGLKA